MKNWYDLEEALQVLLKSLPGLVFLLGEVDTGKTTLMKRAAQAFLDTGLRVGLVDADVGQSTIGPPTTIGMAIVQDTLSDRLSAQALYFVGNNTPVGNLIEVLAGSRQMVDAAFRGGAEVVIFDSSGLVSPPYGHVLKYHKIAMLKPQAIVAIEKFDELEPITAWYSDCDEIGLLRMRPSPYVRPRSTSRRTEYRQEQYRRYFQEATLRDFNTEELLLYPPNFLNDKAEPAGLVVGLQDECWNTVAIGVIDSLDQGTIGIFAPYPPGAHIRGLIGGRIKLSHSGIELGRIRRRALF